MRGGGIVKSKNSEQYNPSVSYADSSLYTREPLTQNILHVLFVRFLLIGKAFIEPRHYGGVFVLQKYRVGSKRTNPVFINREISLFAFRIALYKYISIPLGK